MFDPTEPKNGEVVDADLLRAQLNAVNTAATAPETDPVFAAWLASHPPVSALTNDAGYLTTPLTADLELAGHNVVDVLSLAFGGNTILDLGGAQLKDGTPGGNSGAAISLRNRQLTNQYAMPLADWSGPALQDGLGNAFLTPASAPVVRALDWGSNPPTTVGEWMLRMAAAQSNNGANPIP